MSQGLIRPAAAAVVPDAAGDGGGRCPSAGWRSTVVGLHVAFAVMLAVAVVRTVRRRRSTARRRVLLAALAGLGWRPTLLLGGPASISTSVPRRANAYLAVLVAVVAVLAWQEPSLLFLMFLAFPQVWFVVGSVRAGVLWTLALGGRGHGRRRRRLVTRGEEPLWGPGGDAGRSGAQPRHGAVGEPGAGAEPAAGGADPRAGEPPGPSWRSCTTQQGMAAERERLAREVHDTLAQGYTSIVVLAQTAAAALPPGADGVAERLALIEEVARENLAEARAMVAAFSPVRAGLGDAGRGAAAAGRAVRPGDRPDHPAGHRRAWRGRAGAEPQRGGRAAARGAGGAGQRAPARRGDRGGAAGRPGRGRGSRRRCRCTWRTTASASTRTAPTGWGWPGCATGPRRWAARWTSSRCRARARG